MALDRTGEPIEDEDEAESAVAPVPHECDRGFVDRDADPPLKPCLICKPNLAPEKLREQAFGPDREDDPRPETSSTNRNREWPWPS